MSLCTSEKWIVHAVLLSAQIRLISTAVTGVLMISGPQITSGCVDSTTSHGNAAMITGFSCISLTFHLPMQNQEGRETETRVATPRPRCFVASTISTKALKNRTARERKGRTKRERVLSTTD